MSLDHFFRFLAIYLVLAWSQAFALVSSDKMPTKILKVYDKNVLVLNRGLEDGVFKGDHIKLTSPDGFIARGICLKTSMLLSHWKIYRVVRPELVSKDTLYLLHSMNQSQIPEGLEDLQAVDFSEYYNDISDKDVNEGLRLQQERLAKYDLPESIIEKGGIEEGPTETEKFIGENFNKAAFERDLETARFSVFASPISWESLNEQRNMYFGFTLNNQGEKYGFALQGEQRETSIVDRYTQEEVEKVYRRIDASFTIKNFSDNWSYFSYGLLEQERQGDIENPKAQINIGPVGFYRHFVHPNDKGEEFKIGFIPLFDQRTYEDINEEDQERSGARLGLRLFYQEAITPLVSFIADFWHSPYLDLEKQDLDSDDARTNLKAVLNRKMTENISVEYQLQYLKDITYERDLGVSPENVINTINFRLSTDF